MPIQYFAITFHRNCAIIKKSQAIEALPMQFIDIHTHVYPDEIALKATQSVRDFYHIYGSTMGGTVEQLLSRKQACRNQQMCDPAGSHPA